jgi:hypothetical protein
MAPVGILDHVGTGAPLPALREVPEQ